MPGRGTPGLIADLNRKPPSSFRTELLGNARAGLYHDYESPLPAPKLRLITDLERYGFKDLARNARRGEYGGDEPPVGESLDKLAEEAGLGDIHRRLEAGEITYEQAVMESMSKANLTPEERAVMAAELDNMPEGVDIARDAQAGRIDYATAIRRVAANAPMTPAEREEMEKRTGVPLPGGKMS